MYSWLRHFEFWRVLTNRWWGVVGGHADLSTAVVTAFEVSTAVNIKDALSWSR